MLSVGAMRNFFNRFGNGCALIILGAFAASLVLGYNSGFGNRGNNGRGETANNVIATVNGQNLTESEFQEMYSRLTGRNSPDVGRTYAAAQGETMMNLIEKAVILQEADRRHAHPLDADIDKELDRQREGVSKQMNKPKMSDQEWESFLETNAHITAADLRERLAKDLIPVALLNQLKADEKVTEAEARNQNAQVHLEMVEVPYQDPSSPPPPNAKNKPTLTEAEAKQKIDAYYQDIKSGKDIVKIARANPYDKEGAKRGGDAGSIAEYPNSGQGGFSIDLNLLYGPEFAAAIHKLTDGQTTEVLKMGGLEKGKFAIAKLVARKVETPKDFDIKKAIAAVAQQRATQKFTQLIRALTKSAKIDIKDPDKKTYYDFAKMERASSDTIQDMQNGIASTPPTKAETDAQAALVNKEFEDMLKRHPDDVTAAIMVAENLKNHRMEPGVQDRLLTLNELIAKSTDDYDRHFELADAYREKKQYDKAKIHLDRIARLISYNTPIDLDQMKKADTTYRRLESSYRSIDATPEADKMKQIIAELQTKMTAAALKQQMEEREAAAQRAAAQRAAASAKKGQKGKAGSAPGANDPNSITMPMTSGGASDPIQITPSPSSDSGTPGAGGTAGAPDPLMPTAPSGGTIPGNSPGKKP